MDVWTFDARIPAIRTGTSGSQPPTPCGGRVFLETFFLRQTTFDLP